jgi:hypothetical protein
MQGDVMDQIFYLQILFKKVDETCWKQGGGGNIGKGLLACLEY